MTIKKKPSSLLARHPAFWVVDTGVVLATYAIWGLWDALFTMGVFALALAEGYITGEEA